MTEALDALESLFHVADDFDVNPQERHRAISEALEVLRKHGRDPMDQASLKAFQRRKRKSMQSRMPDQICEVRVLKNLKVSPLDVASKTAKEGQILSYDPKRPGLWVDREWCGGPTLDYAFDGDEPALAVISEDG